MNRTHLVAAGTTAAAAALVTAALVSPSTTAQAADDPVPAPPTATDARVIAPFECDGGAVTKTWNRGISGDYLYVAPGSRVNLPGQFSVRGPQKGKDTLSVSVAGEAYLATGAAMTMQVLVDGQPVRPGGFNTPVYFASGDPGYNSGAAQFCVRLDRGNHNVKVNVGGTSATNGVYAGPLIVHAELSR